MNLGSKYYLLSLCTLTCISTAPVHPQPGSQQRLKFEHITYENGLAGNFAWRIIQDSKGFLWFGTWDGLSRYDGYQLTSFDKDRTGKMSANSVWSIFESRTGPGATSWVGTYERGLNKYDPETQAFTHYQHDQKGTSSFTAMQAGEVRLEIFNLLGQRVRSLINASMPSGHHSVQWDGRNDASQQVVSGLYIYRIQANSFVKTMKMTLMK